MLPYKVFKLTLSLCWSICLWRDGSTLLRSERSERLGGGGVECQGGGGGEWLGVRGREWLYERREWLGGDEGLVRSEGVDTREIKAWCI
jgi:hypothetical protein